VCKKLIKMAKKRERLEVIHDILKSIMDNNNHIGPTKLLYSSNLSPQMFKEYTIELIDKGFIDNTAYSDKKIFSLTKKGFEFIEKYDYIRKFIENFGL
jgi:predicted transcriptional regulator